MKDEEDQNRDERSQSYTALILPSIDKKPKELPIIKMILEPHEVELAKKKIGESGTVTKMSKKSSKL